MLHRAVAVALLLTTLSLASHSAFAQSEGPGYWDNGRWIGYRPLHQRYARQTGQSAVPTAEQAGPNSAMEYSAEPSPNTSQVVPAAASTRVNPKSTRRDGVVRTNFESGVPVQGGHPMTDYTQGPWHGDCAGPACDCGVQGDYCETPCYPAAGCRPRPFWVRAEYLGWWKQGMRLPALVTTNPTTTPALDNANTVVLFGADDVNKDATSGGRFALGAWVDPCQMHGIEFAYTFLGSETTSYHATSDDYAVLGRPFFNIGSAAADADLISFSDPAYTGWVNVVAETGFQGTELLYRRATKRSPNSQVDFLVGWRWLQLKDELRIRESVTNVGGTISLSDQFNTRNNFHGAEFGIQWQRPISSRWTFEVLGKAALGNSHSTVTVAGEQTGDADQGLLALDSNSGTHGRNSFSTITEFGLSVKRRFRSGLVASFGYTLVYWGDVMRAGDQVDLNVDPRQIPPDPHSATHPAVLMNTTDFWAQGLHFGLEYSF